MDVPNVMVSGYEILWYVFVCLEDSFKPLIVRFVSKNNCSMLEKLTILVTKVRY